MLRSTLKRNLFPIVLIALGCLIFFAIILYVFRAHLTTVVWVLLGLLLIGAGVFGIVASNPKNKTRTADETSRSSLTGPGTPPPAMTPKYSAVGTREIKPGRQDTITISRPLLIAAGVLFVCLVLLLLVNVGTVLRSLLTVHKTQIVDCREVARYAEDGWQFVSTYSYRSGDAVSGYTDHTDCVMGRERFVWAKDKRIPEKDEASIDDASIDDASIDDASIDDASIDDASTDDATAMPAPITYVEPTQTTIRQLPPTQTDLLQPPLPQPSPTQMPSPTVTFTPVSSPLPTWTPPPSSTPESTLTMPPSPTLTPVPHTGVNICEATSSDTSLNTYVQWHGMIMGTPTPEDEGLWFQVQWTNPAPDGVCDQVIFFVSFDTTERFFEEDVVLVSGTIIDIAYEYETESGQTAYAAVVRAEKVELLDEL